MEALAAVAGATLLANHLMGSGSCTQYPDPGDTELEVSERSYAGETPAEFLANQLKHFGYRAPTYNYGAARVPWDTNNPPYHIDQYFDTTLDVTPADLKQAYVNAREHERRDVMGQAWHGRRAFARKSGQPMWTGFTAEVSNPADPSMRTQHMQWNWLPMAPTDSDFADAAAVAKAIPPDPALFAPDAWRATYPGMPFRSSYNS